MSIVSATIHHAEVDVDEHRYFMHNEAVYEQGFIKWDSSFTRRRLSSQGTVDPHAPEEDLMDRNWTEMPKVIKREFTNFWKAFEAAAGR